ncbi:hypothetical protein B7463_g8092, partial [Scytalidium lignicola]
MNKQSMTPFIVIRGKWATFLICDIDELETIIEQSEAHPKNALAYRNRGPTPPWTPDKQPMPSENPASSPPPDTPSTSKPPRKMKRLQSATDNAKEGDSWACVITRNEKTIDGAHIHPHYLIRPQSPTLNWVPPALMENIKIPAMDSQGEYGGGLCKGNVLNLEDFKEITSRIIGSSAMPKVIQEQQGPSDKRQKTNAMKSSQYIILDDPTAESSATVSEKGKGKAVRWEDQLRAQHNKGKEKVIVNDERDREIGREFRALIRRAME